MLTMLKNATCLAIGLMGGGALKQYHPMLYIVRKVPSS